jgi:hypothetical protein
MIILGSGLSACLAGIMMPDTHLYEPLSETTTHNAVLRFRTDKISKITGIPFKKVKIYKGIWHNDRPVQLAPKYIVRYARKVSESITARSIVNQETEERFIAPSDLHEQMIHLAGGIEEFGTGIRVFNTLSPVISTIPLNVMCKELGLDIKINTMLSNPIYVSRFEIPNCDIHATNYYTGANTPVYRATLSGSELIVESTFDLLIGDDTEIVKQSFGLDALKPIPIVMNYQQHDGKLTPFNDQERKELLFKLTNEFNIYSLGRYAIWKNILLDDVVQDVEVIKKMMYKTNYDKMRG